jgi:predicted enzyme related to lactoylglutathione lyase
MTIRHEPWPPGTPAWTDVMVPDRLAAHDFYRAVFGWEITDGAPEMGYYANALLKGETVAGIGQSMPGQPAAPPAWTTYLATADAEATAAAVVAAGGTVLAPPMAVMDFGTMAVFTDPTGAVFGVWQSGTHTGADIVDEPGAVVWNEVMSHDFEAGKAFYAAVFGYTYSDMSSEDFKYATFEVDGVTRGGIGALTADMANVPPNWLTYFNVADADVSAATITAHGGAILRAPWDTQFGKMAIVAGPAGEVFALMASPAAAPDDAAAGTA